MGFATVIVQIFHLFITPFIFSMEWYFASAAVSRFCPSAIPTSSKCRVARILNFTQVVICGDGRTDGQMGRATKGNSIRLVTLIILIYVAYLIYDTPFFYSD